VKYYQEKGRANVECKECTELWCDYYNDKLDDNMMMQMNEHLETCVHCQNELVPISSAVNFLKENMPVLMVDNHFTEQIMQRIELEEVTSNIIKPLEGIGLLLLTFTLGMLILLGPTVFSLLMLIGGILLGLLSTAAVVFATFPLIQISSSIILGGLLLLVTVYMRHMVVHDSV
jgi:anti-sigma factor RsiW